MTIMIGQKAPAFHLEGYFKNDFRHYALSEQKGKWVVLFFYPLDFTFVCPTEIQGYNERISDFEKLNAQVFSCSVDSVHSHKAWAKSSLGEMSYPMLSDMKKQIAREYGVLIEDEGISLRGTFIIDPDGVLKYIVVHDNSVGRNVDETLRVLEALQTGELCPVGWNKGKKTLGKK